jgi:hypothetical protein
MNWSSSRAALDGDHASSAELKRLGNIVTASLHQPRAALHGDHASSAGLNCLVNVATRTTPPPFARESLRGDGD